MLNQVSDHEETDDDIGSGETMSLKIDLGFRGKGNDSIDFSSVGKLGQNLGEGK